MGESGNDGGTSIEEANAEENNQEVVSQTSVDNEPGTETKDPIAVEGKETDSEYQTTTHASQEDALCEQNGTSAVQKEVWPVEPLPFDQLDEITPGVTNQLQVRAAAMYYINLPYSGCIAARMNLK